MRLKTGKLGRHLTKGLFMIRRNIILLTMLLGTASPAWAGDVIRENASTDFEWQSSECLRPVRPHIRQSDPSGQALMQGFAMKVAVYLDCLKSEAQRDFDRAQTEMHEAIQSTLQKETDDMNDAVERMVRQQN
jgi:hypothetical protein